jgi:hypothetical protein
MKVRKTQPRITFVKIPKNVNGQTFVNENDYVVLGIIRYEVFLWKDELFPLSLIFIVSEKNLLV